MYILNYTNVCNDKQPRQVLRKKSIMTGYTSKTEAIKTVISDEINLQMLEMTPQEWFAQLPDETKERIGGESARTEYIEVWDDYARDIATGYEIFINEDFSAKSYQIRKALGDKFIAFTSDAVYVGAYYGDSVKILNDLGFTTDEDEADEE